MRMWMLNLMSALLFRHCTVRALPLESSGSREPSLVGQFWHVSDLHLDPSYHLSDDHTKVCASSKGVNASSPGIFGDFMCDSPYELILSAFKSMKDSKQQASFMIWTGDSPPHVPVQELSTQTVINVIANMTATIQGLFPDLQVFPALGNHDYWPQDQLPVGDSEVYSAVAELWKPWLSEEAITTLRKGGFYSQLYKTDAGQNHPLRIISLNTVLYYSPNMRTLNMTDPANQFEWLEETLESSRQNGEKVYIIAHVPIGYLAFVANTTAMRPHFNERLVKIFRNYSNIIAGQFYGHTHRDSIMVLLDEQGNPVNAAFIVPAVTPIKSLTETSCNNPGYRFYQYQPDDYSLLDLWHYYLNLTEANMKMTPLWKLEYVMTKAYGIESLHPQNLYDLSKQFKEDGSQLFDDYYKHYLVSCDDHVGCDRQCKINQLCSIGSLDETSYMNCINNGGF
ncbi:cyclic GMP-AMP phosphodiesterase SMPDL3A [Ambystoma mexicanum]|uniref:cyclic GMP-AMP phosphodiesterase SMPDL3A n=1 Tax=Ambystoma mexicanum TaxID=8296 RepID=UPI0037E98F6C